MQPGNSGTEATKIPSSSSSIKTLYFIMSSSILDIYILVWQIRVVPSPLCMCPSRGGFPMFFEIPAFNKHRLPGCLCAYCRFASILVMILEELISGIPLGFYPNSFCSCAFIPFILNFISKFLIKLFSLSLNS